LAPLKLPPFKAALAAPTVLLAISLAIAMATAPPAFGQSGWLAFDSSEVVPSSSPLQFTIRYPLGFERSRPMDLPDLPGAERQMGKLRGRMSDFFIQEFAGEVLGPGRLVGLTLVRNPDASVDLGFFERLGPQAYWDLVGRQRAAALGRFDGATPLKFGGLDAGDMRFTTNPVPIPAPVELTSLSIQRGIFKGGEYLLLTCAYLLPSSEARAEGLTSHSNPALEGYCKPFFESLRFKV
jgi:hypothetical protein